MKNEKTEERGGHKCQREKSEVDKKVDDSRACAVCAEQSGVPARLFRFQRTLSQESIQLSITYL